MDRTESFREHLASFDRLFAQICYAISPELLDDWLHTDVSDFQQSLQTQLPDEHRQESPTHPVLAIAQSETEQSLSEVVAIANGQRDPQNTGAGETTGNASELAETIHSLRSTEQTSTRRSTESVNDNTTSYTGESSLTSSTAHSTSVFSAVSTDQLLHDEEGRAYYKVLVSPAQGRTRARFEYRCGMAGCKDKRKDKHTRASFHKHWKNAHVKNLVCDWPECGHRETWPSKMERHKRECRKGTHTNDRLFTCECGHTFSRQGNLGRHMKTCPRLTGAQGPV